MDQKHPKSAQSRERFNTFLSLVTTTVILRHALAKYQEIKMGNSSQNEPQNTSK